ncbi:MAG: MgtC/SapB family protein [Alphaproteobacteria bacterium]
MQHFPEILLNILAALAAGAVIGLERSHSGRPAGFRTHALVCLSSAVLMVASNYQADWLAVLAVESIRTDPIRMAQGIMTGIGFLGAGVIFKEGLTVRGLTTAASIWTTAAIGILYGVGFLVPATLATVLTIGVLGAFRLVETRLPTQIYAQFIVRFPTAETMAEPDLRRMLEGYGFVVSQMSYHLDDDGRRFEYSMMLRTLEKKKLERLAADMREMSGIAEFSISPPPD